MYTCIYVCIQIYRYRYRYRYNLGIDLIQPRLLYARHIAAPAATTQVKMLYMYRESERDKYKHIHTYMRSQPGLLYARHITAPAATTQVKLIYIQIQIDRQIDLHKYVYIDIQVTSQHTQPTSTYLREAHCRARRNYPGKAYMDKDIDRQIDRQIDIHKYVYIYRYVGAPLDTRSQPARLYARHIAAPAATTQVNLIQICIQIYINRQIDSYTSVCIYIDIQVPSQHTYPAGTSLRGAYRSARRNHPG